MVETNLSKLGSEISLTEDDIPSAKVQMNHVRNGSTSEKSLQSVMN